MNRLLILSVIFLFISNPVSSQGKYEPGDGCYIGGFIVNDPVVQGNVDQFETITGKKHSIYFSYAGWGQPFPIEWVSYYASRGNVVQIAFEPNGGLTEVVDGEYIRKWAREANQSGAPILLRWACEMNGNWVAWHGNPTLYKEKFRLISAIMKEEAPNVAMVWAPNDIPNVPGNPLYDLHGYYPGDQYVDWVGIDFYGVYFYENGTPERKDPREKLRVVYDVYANRKPIIVCEWAATHYTVRVNPPQDCTQYAIAQMDSLYRNVQSQFPKLKAICWFSANTLTQNGCNYSLLENQQVLNHYKVLNQSGHFRTGVFRNIPLVKITNVPSDSVIRFNGTVEADINCETGIDSVILFLNDIRISKVVSAPYHIPLVIDNIPDGFYELKVFAYSSSGFYNFDIKNIIIDKANNYSSIIIDDVAGNNFSFSGAWNISSSQPDRYGPYYHYSVAGVGENIANWIPSVNNSGYYVVSAFWSQHSNRADNSPYIVFHSTGVDTVRVNQKEKGGQFNKLGTYRFTSTDFAQVKLTNDANGIVIADAVKFEWAFLSEVWNDEYSNTPDQLTLYQNYPNPFNPVTQIKYIIPETGLVNLRVFNILGKEISLLKNELQGAGEHTIQFAGDNLPSGIYICRLISGNYVKNIKMALIK